MSQRSIYVSGWDVKARLWTGFKLLQPWMTCPSPCCGSSSQEAPCGPCRAWASWWSPSMGGRQPAPSGRSPCREWRARRGQPTSCGRPGISESWTKTIDLKKRYSIAKQFCWRLFFLNHNEKKFTRLKNGENASWIWTIENDFMWKTKQIDWLWPVTFRTSKNQTSKAYYILR